MPVIAMDCEMVTTTGGEKVARVSIVDQQGNILLDEYVKPTEQVTDYKTYVSGIKKEKLLNGKSLNYVQSKVSNMINGNVLVGHSLDNDLKYLKLSYSESYQRDIASYEPFRKNGQSQSLKNLAMMYLNKNIQVGEHDSVEDARTALQLYNLVANNWHS